MTTKHFQDQFLAQITEANNMRNLGTQSYRYLEYLTKTLPETKKADMNFKDRIIIALRNWYFATTEQKFKTVLKIIEVFNLEADSLGYHLGMITRATNSIYRGFGISLGETISPDELDEKLKRLKSILDSFDDTVEVEIIAPWLEDDHQES